MIPYAEIREWLARRRALESVQPKRTFHLERAQDGAGHSVINQHDDIANTECGRTIRIRLEAPERALVFDPLFCKECVEYMRLRGGL